MSELIQEDCICGHMSESHYCEGYCKVHLCNCNQYKDSYFYTSDGMLNAYALHCGYIEKTERDGISITLYCEHDVYHVRGYDFNNHVRLFWNSYRTLSPAKKDYKRAIKAQN